MSELMKDKDFTDRLYQEYVNRHYCECYKMDLKVLQDRIYQPLLICIEEILNTRPSDLIG